MCKINADNEFTTFYYDDDVAKGFCNLKLGKSYSRSQLCYKVAQRGKYGRFQVSDSREDALQTLPWFEQAWAKRRLRVRGIYRSAPRQGVQHSMASPTRRVIKQCNDGPHVPGIALVTFKCLILINCCGQSGSCERNCKSPSTAWPKTAVPTTACAKPAIARAAAADIAAILTGGPKCLTDASAQRPNSWPCRNTVRTKPERRVGTRRAQFTLCRYVQTFQSCCTTWNRARSTPCYTRRCVVRRVHVVHVPFNKPRSESAAVSLPYRQWLFAAAEPPYQHPTRMHAAGERHNTQAAFQQLTNAPQVSPHSEGAHERVCACLHALLFPQHPRIHPRELDLYIYIYIVIPCCTRASTYLRRSIIVHNSRLPTVSYGCSPSGTCICILTCFRHTSQAGPVTGSQLGKHTYTLE